MIMSERRRGLIMFKHLIKRLQNLLQILHTRLPDLNAGEFEEVEENGMVPDDVKEGHFAILAGKNEERGAQRFVVELCLLKHPAFLKLMELAEEEYGFEHKGALVLPCRADELQKILQQIM
ncbi:auxin-responsive protein SAUR50-like [Olea europaea var. sylvestris]|uniref:auxin-responsive protein SAUR50-like n=1 Tax=Olea europaea var. sylvestris TaxID=158386 RepID=UPI000C1D79A2|nr:auxin-responsive protein SAUR50-like [Olea europaea var. sylvestris]